MPNTLWSEHLLAAIVASSEDALLSFGLEGTVHSWNAAAERLYGYGEEEMRGQPLARLLPPCEAASYEEIVHAAVKGEFPAGGKTERVCKDGSLVRVAVKHTPVRNEQGDIVGILESGRPLRCELAEATAAEKAQIAVLAEQMPIALWTTDKDLRVRSHWGAGFRGNRVLAGEFVGRSVFEYLKCPDARVAAIAQHYETLRGASARFEYKRGSRVFEVHLEPLRNADSEIIGCVGAGLDITERKKSEERVRYQATHDALTGLANYREFLDTLEREVRRAERSQHPFAVLLLDLDDLKRINDRLRHLAGNRALQRLSEAMKEQCRSTDLPARYGGDEFAVVLIDADPGMANQVAERVEGALRNDGKEPALSVSIGSSVYPDDGHTAQELLEAADRKLYRRKRESRGRSVGAR